MSINYAHAHPPGYMVHYLPSGEINYVHREPPAPGVGFVGPGGYYGYDPTDVRNVYRNCDICGDLTCHTPCPCSLNYTVTKYTLEEFTKLTADHSAVVATMEEL